MGIGVTETNDNLDYDLLKTQRDEDRKMAYSTSTSVVIDEVDYLLIAMEEVYLFFQFISYDYEKNSIITSNKSFGNWQELFADPVITTVILDADSIIVKLLTLEGIAIDTKAIVLHSRKMFFNKEVIKI